MSAQSQQARSVMGWVLGIAAFSPLALCYESLNPGVATSEVTGRVTYSGCPVADALICLDSGSGNPSAVGKLESDGSFRLQTAKGRIGAFPGHYHAYLCKSRTGSPSVPAKFLDPRTSGLEIEIASGWSDLNIDLH